MLVGRLGVEGTEGSDTRGTTARGLEGAAAQLLSSYSSAIRVCDDLYEELTILE